MAPHRQPRLVPLPEAARLSGPTAGDLRRWCATGRLRCERLGDDWLVLEDDIHLAIDLRDAAAGGAGRAVLSIEMISSSSIAIRMGSPRCSSFAPNGSVTSRSTTTAA